MKIRWTEHSVRFRITPLELETLQRGAAIRAALQLGQAQAWQTEIKPAATTEIAFADCVLSVTIADADLEELAAPENEGVYFRNGELRYFIEKDFPCAHPRAGEAEEPKAATFEAPAGFEARKNS